MENALTREQTIRGITIWAAKAAFEEKQKGSLEKGKFADFIVISKDIFNSDPNAMLETKVLRTVVNGRVAYDNIFDPEKL